MDFRIRGLSPDLFRPFFGLPDDVLARRRIERHVADASPGFPDRIELRDAEPGERLLLLNFTHQPAATPYRASHAIYVLEDADRAYDRVGEIPPVMRSRPISLRAFDGAGRMIGAALAEGAGLASAIRGLLTGPRVAYLHAHFARPGCYAARIERA
jgi:hypothetical protein